MERNRQNYYLPRPLATIIMEACGVSLDRLRADLMFGLPSGQTEDLADVHLAPEFADVEASARRAANDISGGYVGTEHLLMGLVDLEQTTAGQVLARYGLSIEQVREQILPMQRQR